MKNDDLYRRNGSNSGTPNSRLNKKSSISSDQTESFRMIDIDVKKAKKDIDDIFSYTKDRLKDNSKEFSSSSDDIFKKASSQSDQFFKDLSTKIDQLFNTVNSQIDKLERRASDMGMTIAEEVAAGYDLAYDSADLRHKRSIANRLKEEQKLARNIGKMYEESLSNNPNINAMVDSVNKATEEAKRQKKEKDNTIYSARDVLTDSDARGINTEAYMNGLKTAIVGAIIDGGKQFVNIWINRFESGMRRIVDTYEDTFHNVSVLTDTSQKAYRQMQDEIQSYLKDNNLNNAIRISDAMQSVHDAVMQGITNAGEAQNIALEDSISKSINPFLDTTSEAYKDLQSQLDSIVMNGLNGVVKAVNDNVGQTRFVSKNLNDMIDAFEPVIQNARDEKMTNDLADLASLIESRLASGEIETLAEAQRQYEFGKQSLQQYDILSNGTVVEQQSVINALNKMQEQGISNTEDNAIEISKIFSDEFNNINKMYAQQNQGNLLSGSIRNTELGTSVFSYNTEAQTQDIDRSDTVQAFKELTGNLEDTYTNLWQKDTGAENNMTDIAQFEQQYPDAFKILKSIASTLSQILAAIAGNFIANKFVGKFGSGSNTGSLFDMFKSDVKSNGFKKTIKDYAKTFGDDVVSKFKNSKIFEKGSNLFSKVFKNGADDVAKAATSYGDDVLKAAGAGASKSTGILSKLGSAASKASGPLAALGFVIDGISGFTKSNDWYGDNSAESKTKSILGSLLGGSGQGVGQESAGSVALNAGSNALKWGSLGLAVGGPLGAGIGAAAGGIAGLIGGERLGDLMGKLPGVSMIGKTFDTLKENISSLGGELKDVWSDDNLKLSEKLGASFGTVKASITDTFKDTLSNIKEAYDESFITDMVDGLKSFGDKAVDVLGNAKDKFIEFGKDMKDEFNKFTDDPIDYIKEKGKNALDSIKDFGKSAWDTLGDAKDSVVNFFKDMGSASDKYENKAKEADKKENQSKGSHASGLNYVPYDGYVASLHKGETVFNRTASNIISQFMGLTGTSNSVNTARIIKTLISNDKNINATTATDKADFGNRIAKVSEKLFNGNNAIQQNFDTTNLEKAIYAIGDKIVTAISNQSKNRNREIVDRNTGTVNVNFGNRNKSVDLSMAELPV